MLINGCTTLDTFLANNQTNYVIATPSVSEEAESGYVFWFSYSSFGMLANTMALGNTHYVIPR